MSAEASVVLISLGLILGNAFFVAAEYALVGARKSKIEAMAKRGHSGAKLALRATQNLSKWVAGMQIAITMFGIGVGSITEPFITAQLTKLMGTAVPEFVRVTIAIVIVTFVLVVVGELVPKYLSLRHPDRVVFAAIRPLGFFVALLQPLAWVAQTVAGLILRLFGIDMRHEEGDALPKEELQMLIRAGGAEGLLEKTHAEFVARALHLDILDARDIMIHRLDVKWLDADLDRDALMRKLKAIPFTRLPVCRGDIDEMVGVVYLHDVVKHLDDPKLTLEALARPAVFIPENLSLDRIIATMREQKTQMVIVLDEYGGTSGLVTLEDVVEEVFGELEDRLESERPQIEVFPGGRVSARADVRIDELVRELGLPLDVGENTDTLATIVVNELERMPKPGDSVDTVLGILRVENMARRRITRVSIQLAETSGSP